MEENMEEGQTQKGTVLRGYLGSVIILRFPRLL